MTTRIQIDTNAVIGAIDERIYSSFIEHMGRAVYTGIYEPEHPSADAFGFRQDVMELIRPLNLSCIRYPGGNFLSGYDWRDGIGPKENRPVRPELAWFALEPNQVGTDDFLQWCERVGTKAMLGVNLGTGTPQSACDLLEYVNGTLPTKYADLRRSNGHVSVFFWETSLQIYGLEQSLGHLESILALLTERKGEEVVQYMSPWC